MIDLHQKIAAIVDRLLRNKDTRLDDRLQDACRHLEDGERLEQSLVEYADFKRRHAHRRSKAYGRVRSLIRKDRARPMVGTMVYTLAAGVVLVLSVGIFIAHRSNQPPVTESLTAVKARTIMPGGRRATLTVDDGHSIALDPDAGGIVMDGRITYKNGKVVEGTAVADHKVLTVTTPRGGEYALQLSDGTTVFLNADSRITYPARFSDTARTVYLTGEAYFDVMKDAGRPFHVVTGQNRIRVLGTQFNVKAYADEPSSYVTLVEGAVRVSDGSQEVAYLKPGFQSVSGGGRTVIREVSVEDFTSWKSGVFTFSDVPLETAMRELARWYDHEVEVSPSAQGIRIWGALNRYDRFDKVLEILKLVDKELEINIAGRKITINRINPQ